MKLDENGWLVLDDGTELASSRYSGLSLTPDGVLAVGYDDCLWTETEALTEEQRREIAQFMVARWKSWGGLEDPLDYHDRPGGDE